MLENSRNPRQEYMKSLHMLPNYPCNVLPTKKHIADSMTLYRQGLDEACATTIGSLYNHPGLPYQRNTGEFKDYRG